MFTGHFETPSVHRLEGLLKNRYGMGFRVASIVDAQEVEVGDTKGEVRGGALYVTICSRGKYLATAILSGADKLHDEDVETVTELCKLVLEPALYSSYLEQIENNQKNPPADFDDHFENSNLIDLFQPTVTTAAPWTKQGPAFLSALVLLESQNPQAIQRVGVHVHELSERWAMVNFRDVRHQMKSVRDLQELGAITIIVHDVQSLTSAEQQLMLDFLAAQKSSLAEPLFLLGGIKPWPVLRASTKILPEMIAHLENHRLELDRLPQDFSRLKSALELFLDHKAVLI